MQGICFDEKSSFQRGAAIAPNLIRKAMTSPSTNSFSELGVDLNEIALIDVGNFKPNYEEIENICKQHLEEADKLFTLGGDHSIAFPIVKAIAEKRGKFDILQIDAHSDLYHEFEGDPFSHACPFARIMEAGLCDRLIQVGIRCLTPHQIEQANKYGVTIIEMKDYALEKIPAFDKPIYLSLDMDGIDPAYAPGVSHHEPGGFSSRQVLDIIHHINVDIIGADLVEFNPDRDHAGITASLAGKLAKEILCKMGNRRQT
jgi:agmatinase